MSLLCEEVGQNDGRANIVGRNGDRFFIVGEGFVLLAFLFGNSPEPDPSPAVLRILCQSLLVVFFGFVRIFEGEFQIPRGNNGRSEVLFDLERMGEGGLGFGGVSKREVPLPLEGPSFGIRGG